MSLSDGIQAVGVSVRTHEWTLVGRAYSSLEFAVANTLAKWKKWEPNEISFSQGFSPKLVSTSCFVFNSLAARGDSCRLLITFANRLDLIWNQTV